MRLKSRKPVRYTPRVWNAICRQLELGKSLRKTVKGAGMPSLSNVMAWLKQRPQLQEQYARVRERGIQLHIDGILDLADTANAQNAHAVRLRVDTRKWLASKILPRLYGDRFELQGSSSPMAIEAEELSPLEQARRLIFALQLGEKELKSMGFDELAKFLKVEGLIQERKLLPAPEIEINPAGTGH